jgi:hypothetical protein
MRLRSYELLEWRAPEWGSLVLIFSLLLLHPLLNGFPFMFPDSWGYSGACPDEMRSPVLGCAMRPFTWVGGNWAYAVVQSAATAFGVVLLWSRALKRRHTGALYAALIASGLGLFSGWVMADVWTLIGLICLFVIASGHFHPVAAALLAFSCGTHFGNFPAFSTAGLAMLPFVHAKLRYTVRIAVCLLGSAALIVAFNLIGGQIKFGSGNGFVFMASRILHDIPEVLERKCREDPEFRLCQRKEEILGWSAENHQGFTWAGFYNLGFAWPEYNRVCRELVLYSVSSFPGFVCSHGAAAVRNTLQLLVFSALSNGLETFDPDSIVAEDLRIAFPADVQPYLNSQQAGGALERLVKQLDPAFRALTWLSMLVCLGSALIFRKSIRDDIMVRLGLFALFAYLANAFFMANLSGVFGRYQARIAFLLFLPGFALMARLAAGLANRLRLRRRSTLDPRHRA